ncbi:hypothetical protein GCM10011380_18790 [Sphingomonas metalli]|uniref:Uncharacterized protein n=2 Tax=Sphingomonas metalli TaxID=1779358 RepID=A0A916T4S5_9SPHN|nr:hypothetical protein GCM10011380_18790 [Sphingomonas metalli]
MLASAYSALLRQRGKGSKKMIERFSAGATAVAKLYGHDNVGDFIVSHIATLQGADNALVSRCGEVLAAVREGFGVGGEHSLMVIALGQTLLSGGVVPVGGVVSLSNPVTLTCAAIGAIHYGWNALSEQEKAAILASVATIFATGVESVRSVAGFVLKTIKALLSRENLAALKKMASDGAAYFDRCIGDITRSIADRSRDLYQATWKRLPDVASSLPVSLPFRRAANVTPSDTEITPAILPPQ